MEEIDTRAVDTTLVYLRGVDGWLAMQCHRGRIWKHTKWEDTQLENNAL